MRTTVALTAAAMAVAVPAAGRANEAPAPARPTQESTDYPEIALSLWRAGDYAAAEPYFRAVAEVRERLLGEGARQTLVALNNLGTLLVYDERYAEAVPIFERGLALSERHLGAADLHTITMLANRATTAQEMGDYPLAERLQHQALDRLVETFGPDHDRVIQLRENLGTLLYLQGRYAEALAMGERALGEAERRFGPQDERTVGLRANVALTLQGLARYAEADRLLGEVLDQRRLALGLDHPDTLKTMNDRAVLLERMGRIEEAEALFADVMERRERTLGPNHLSTLMTVSNYAGLLEEVGRFAEAEPLFLRVLEGREAALGPNHPLTHTALNNLAYFYRTRGRFAEAEPLYRRAYEGRMAVQGADHPETLNAMSNLAALQYQMGRYDEAAGLLEDAHARAQRVLGPDHPESLTIANNLANLMFETGEPLRAHDIVRDIARRTEALLGPDHPDTLRSLSNLGGYAFRAMDYDEAARTYRDVMERRSSLLGPLHPDTGAAALRLATTMLEAGDDPAALAPARIAADAIRAYRARFIGQAATDRLQADSELAAFGRTQPAGMMLFADAAYFAAEAGTGPSGELLAEAYAAVQDAMAGSASQAIVDMAVRRFASEAGASLGALVRESRSLGEEFASISEQYSLSFGGTSAEDEALRVRLRAERERIRSRIDEIDARLRAEFPDYFALIRPEALDLPAARGLLGADEVLLLVLPGPRGTHVFTLTREAVHWYRSQWTEHDVAGAVRSLRWDVGATVSVTPEQQAALEARTAEAGGEGFDFATARELYGEILAPAEQMLEGKRHVIVAAGGALASLPFSILVVPGEGDAGGADGLADAEWLADRFALTHIPSVQSLQLLRRVETSGAGDRDLTFAGFGDPVLAGAARTRGPVRGASAPDAATVFSERRTRSGGGIANVSALRTMARLPGTAIELENMRRALGAPESAVHVAEEATETAVRTADLSGARILAFATHGLAAGEMSDVVEPGLVMTPPARASEEDDGYLSASEVASLRLDADWVILSACNTATGEDGSGLSALARAFFYAGARNLLASHWPVDDEVAARITVRTIELGRDDPSLGRAAAFRQAMHEIRADAAHPEWAHPAYWAPFVLIGDGGGG